LLVAEVNSSGGWQHGYVYAGSQLLAIQQNWQLNWVFEDTVTKSKRVTDVCGNVVSTVELDPWGADTNRSTNSAFQPQSFTSYTRDLNGDQDAMARRYSVTGRFTQPDPYSGSYDLSDPQSLNRYIYTKNDPVNRRDPSGLVSLEDWGGDPTKRHFGGWEGALASGGGFSFIWLSIPGIERDHPSLLIGLYFGFGGQQDFDHYWHPKPGSPSECHRFAAIVEELARKNSDPQKFMQALKKEFLDRNAPEWGSGGFKPEFRDDTPPRNSPNQVYHYVGTFEAGYEGAKTLGYELGFRAGYAVTREHEQDYEIRRGPRGTYEAVPLPETPSHRADTALNGVSVDHGARLGAGLIKPKDLAGSIRKEVCQ
jgi:RHS repeat-associated protein